MKMKTRGENIDKKFTLWQNDMKKIYNEFRQSVDKLQESPTKLTYFDVFEKNEQKFEAEIENQHAIEIVIQEIGYLECELANIITLLSMERFSQNERVIKMKNKLEKVRGKIGYLKDRAYAIRSQYVDY